MRLVTTSTVAIPFLKAIERTPRSSGPGRRADLGSGKVGPAGVLHAHRDPLLDRGRQRQRVEDAGAEVGELGGLLEGNRLDRPRGRDDPRIGGHHAVDVRPDLHRLRVERRRRRARPCSPILPGRGSWSLPRGSSRCIRRRPGSGPARRRCERVSRTRRSVSCRSGCARPNRSSVTTSSRESTGTAGRDRAARARATTAPAAISPCARKWSRPAGGTDRRTATARAIRESSSKYGATSASTAGEPVRRRSPAATRSVSRCSPGKAGQSARLLSRRGQLERFDEPVRRVPDRGDDDDGTVGRGTARRSRTAAREPPRPRARCRRISGRSRKQALSSVRAEDRFTSAAPSPRRAPRSGSTRPPRPERCCVRATVNFQSSSGQGFRPPTTVHMPFVDVDVPPRLGAAGAREGRRPAGPAPTAGRRPPRGRGSPPRPLRPLPPKPSARDPPRSTPCARLRPARGWSWRRRRAEPVPPRPSRAPPRIFATSLSIFSASPGMSGITLPRMSSDATPG